MSSKAITEKPDEHVGWQSVEETAPSVLAADEPTVARVIGFIGLLFFVLGAVAIGFDLAGSKRWIGGGFGSVLALFGLCGLLYHVARETDTQIRRVYGVLGGAGLIVAAIVSAVYPAEAGTGAHFLPWGVITLAIGLMFILPAIRGETELAWRNKGVLLVGAVGLACAGTGLIGGNISTKFLLPWGLWLSIIGLAYLGAFIILHGADSDIGHRAGSLLGYAGGIAMIVAVAHSLVLRFAWFGVQRDMGYLTSAGCLLCGVGLFYAIVSLLLVSDRPTAVLTRRELASYFYSPLAYFVLVGFALMAWLDYWIFVSQAEEASRMGQPMVEPIVWPYIWGIIPVIFFILVVPLLTMRLLSEEQRTGTLEVLFTVPLPELPVVLGKFWAVLLMFLLTWVPYGAFLIALRVEGGHAFDYRPIISFVIALGVSGAGVLSMGLFFSSLTKSQVAAGVMTAMGMMALTGVYFAKMILRDSNWQTVLNYFSYIDLWRTTLQGKLALGDLVFHLGFTVFFLFATVKVLESRKWR
jgi:ABC-type transport system involved in multi-copper enzyme maturation permease subunit